MAQGDVLKSYQISDFTNAIDISFDDKYIAVAIEYPFEVQIIEESTGNLINTFTSDTYFRDVCYHPSKTEIVIVDRGGRLAIYNYVTGNLVGEYMYDIRISTCDISPDGSKIAFGGDNYVELMDYETLNLIGTFYISGDWMDEVIFSNDSSMIGAGTSNGPLSILEVDTGNILIEYYQGSDGVQAICFAPDDSYVVFGGYSMLVERLEISTGNIINSKKMSNYVHDVYHFQNFDKFIVTVNDYFIINVNDFSIDYKDSPINYMKHFAVYSHEKYLLVTGRDSNYNYFVYKISTGLKPPLDVVLTMPGYYSSQVMIDDISKESTTEMNGYCSNPIAFDMAKIVDIFRKILDVNPQITRKATEEELEITRVADSKTLDIVKVGDAYE